MGFWEFATFVLIIPVGMILGIVVVLPWLVVRSVKGGGKCSRAQEIEETEMIQDIYRGLQKMEQRVEALETLLLEKERKDKQT